MKKQFLMLVASISLTFVSAQDDNTFPYPNYGNVGIGTGASQSNVKFNFQVHGTKDYIVDIKDSPALTEKSGLNYGKTSRIGLTNSITGSLASDGTVFRMSKYNFYLTNLERQNMTFNTGATGIILNGSLKRIWMGSDSYYIPSTSTEYAATNLMTLKDNGLYIRTKSNDESKYGLSVRIRNNNGNAIQVVNTSGNEINFAVKPDGKVFARKYTTTLNPFPDYVFEKDYELMSLETLQKFIDENKHLPNIPTAAQIEENGADLGELNRLLVEKVEELTLYILQMEKRLKAIEEQK